MNNSCILFDDAGRLIPPLFPPDAQERVTVASSPFPTPDEVDARWADQTGPAYDQFKSLVDKKLKQGPASQGVYSVDIPHNVPQDVVARVRAELALSGWDTTQGSSAKNEPYMEFWRKSRPIT